MATCSMCGNPIPDNQEVCSMCYGDIDYGTDGYARQYFEEQEQGERRREDCEHEEE